jgi:hypothetical protein
MNLYIKDFKGFLNESAEQINNAISYGITNRKFIQTPTHNLDTYIEDLTLRLIEENASKSVKINYNDPTLLVVVFSATKWDNKMIEERNKLYDDFYNLTKKRSTIGIPVALVIQESNSEMKFEVPYIDQEGKSIERTPIVMNDVYIQVIGGSDENYIEEVKEKLELPVQKSNIERIGSFGTSLNKGLLIQRKKYGGSCIVGHGGIIGDIISNIFI